MTPGPAAVPPGTARQASSRHWGVLAIRVIALKLSERLHSLVKLLALHQGIGGAVSLGLALLGGYRRRTGDRYGRGCGCSRGSGWRLAGNGNAACGHRNKPLVQVDVALHALFAQRAQFIGLLFHLAVEHHDLLLQLLDLHKQRTEILAAGGLSCRLGALRNTGCRVG